MEKKIKQRMADTSMEVEMEFQGRSGNQKNNKGEANLPFKNPNLSKSIVIQSINEVGLTMDITNQNNSSEVLAKQGQYALKTDATLVKINETSVSESHDFSNFTKYGGLNQSTEKKADDPYHELKLSQRLEHRNHPENQIMGGGQARSYQTNL